MRFQKMVNPDEADRVLDPQKELSKKDALLIYALGNQAYYGDQTKDRPWGPIALLKWYAWNGQKGKDKDTAK